MMPIGQVVTSGRGQCILYDAYWSCCHMWAGPVYVGGASVSCMVPIGHAFTCGRGQCMWVGLVYPVWCLLVMLSHVGGASVFQEFTMLFLPLPADLVCQEPCSKRPNHTPGEVEGGGERPQEGDHAAVYLPQSLYGAV